MSIEQRAISPLRQRIIEDMRLRKLGEKTQSGYLRWVTTPPWWGETVTLRFDPSAPPQRPLQVCHQGQVCGLARVVETYANCFVKRERPSRTLSADAPATQPPASALRLRELASDSADGEGR